MRYSSRGWTSSASELRSSLPRLFRKDGHFGFVCDQYYACIYELVHFGGPILLDSDDEEAIPASTMPSVTACPSKRGASNPDALETQPFELNTQVLCEALHGLDKTVPSPGRRFAEDKTMVLSPNPVDVRSPDALPTPRVDVETTPSPRGTQPADITPIKEYPTRDQQLAVKGTNEMDKQAKKAASKAAKEAKEASRGRGRGRGGRGRGRKSTPEAGAAADEAAAVPDDANETGDEVDDVPDKPVEETKKNKGGRPKKHQGDEADDVPDKPVVEVTKKKNKRGQHKKDQGDEADDVADKPAEETKKNKGGRPRKAQCEPVSEPAEKKKKKKKAGRTARKGAAPQEVTAVPAARVRGKRCIDQVPEPRPKKVQTLSGTEWPNTFARRYRPAKPNHTQKFWEGCVCAFRNVLVAHLEPGTATATQAQGFRLKGLQC